MAIDVAHVAPVGGQEGIDHRPRLRAEGTLEIAELDDLEDGAFRPADRGRLGPERGRRGERGREGRDDQKPPSYADPAYSAGVVWRGRGGGAVPPSGPISSSSAISAPSPWRKPARRMRV